jgi:hypothetical protein
MPLITCFFGLILCGLSGFTFWIQNKEFELGTWMIPSGFGLVLIILGLLSQFKPGARKHAMHAAAMLGLIGAVMSLSRGIPLLLKLVRDQEINMLQFGMLWSMAIVCLTFVGVCVQSFIAARKARQASEAQPSTPS